MRLRIDTSSDPSVRPIGACKVRDLTVDRVAAWSAANERTLASTTARKALIMLGQICRYAARRGWLAGNPVAKLEPAEKPRWRPQRTSILEGEQLALLLDHSGLYRPLFDFLAHTGLRISESLGLSWADISFDAGLIRVHHQLNRHRQLAPLKTEAARREVILAPALANTLRQHWLASHHKAPLDFVFANPHGRGLNYGHGRRSLPPSRQDRRPSCAGQADPPQPAPHLRLPSHRQRPPCRIRQPPAWTRPPRHHLAGVLAPLRRPRPRRHRPRGA